jgi:hypothetical protein
MSEEGVDGLSPGSHLNPLAQSRGFMGGGQFPAGPSGPAVIPDGGWKAGSNSLAIGIGVVVWKIIEGVGPPVIVAS